MSLATLDERFSTEVDSRKGMKQHDNFIEIGLGFMQRGIPEAIFENRAGPWLAHVDADVFLRRVDHLLLNGTQDQWDSFSYSLDPLSPEEWGQIADIQTGKRGKKIYSLEQSNEVLAEANGRLREYVWGVSFALAATLVTNFFDGKNTDATREILPTAQIEKLTDEQIKILRQQTELFLQQNREIEVPAEQ